MFYTYFRKKRKAVDSVDNSSDGTDSKRQIVEESKGNDIVILPGTGRLSSSGKYEAEAPDFQQNINNFMPGITIQGYSSKFSEELEPGDAIIVFHPTTLQDETKIVRMVLSNTSIGISSAFSSDLMSTTPFRYELQH